VYRAQRKHESSHNCITHFTVSKPRDFSFSSSHYFTCFNLKLSTRLLLTTFECLICELCRYRLFDSLAVSIWLDARTDIRKSFFLSYWCIAINLKLVGYPQTPEPVIPGRFDWHKLTYLVKHQSINQSRRCIMLLILSDSAYSLLGWLGIWPKLHKPAPITWRSKRALKYVTGKGVFFLFHHVWHFMCCYYDHQVGELCVFFPDWHIK